MKDGKFALETAPKRFGVRVGPDKSPSSQKISVLGKVHESMGLAKSCRPDIESSLWSSGVCRTKSILLEISEAGKVV